MKDRLASMSPVAQVHYLNHENALLQGGLQDSAQKLFKLRQEVTGAMQVVWLLAKRNGGTIEIPAVDLITVGGSIGRTHDVERDVYIFTAIDQTDEEVEKLAAALGVEIVEEQPETSVPSTDGNLA